jgi:hypothetical protein
MAKAPAAQASVAKRDPASANVRTKTNMARRCAVVKHVKIPSRQAEPEESSARSFQLGERRIDT